MRVKHARGLVLRAIGTVGEGDLKGGETMDSASVKVMRSYDYCHFEIALGVNDLAITLDDVDELRKSAQRLADKAVAQYRIAKQQAEDRLANTYEVARLRDRARIIRENYPRSEWTPDQQAEVKAAEDAEFRASHEYDYEDDWER